MAWMRTCFQSPPLLTLCWAPPSIHVPSRMRLCTHTHKSGTGREAGQLMEQHKRTLISLVPLLVTCLSLGMWKMNGWGWIGMRCSFHWMLCVEKLVCPLLVPSSILHKFLPIQFYSSFLNELYPFSSNIFQSSRGKFQKLLWKKWMIVLLEVTGINPSLSSCSAQSTAFWPDLKYEKLHCFPLAFCCCGTIAIKANRRAPTKFTKLDWARIWDRFVCCN